MLQMRWKQALAIFLAAIMVGPFPVQAASTAAVLGSISSYGNVTVSDVLAPRESTLFSGDVVNTRSGNAEVQYKEVQYKQGARVLLASDSSALFSASAIELRDGQMSFRSGSDATVSFNASSLQLEPAPGSSANVTLKDGKATVAVTEGNLEVIDPTGAKLASVAAGETKLFAMASPVADPAAASAAAAPPAPAAAKKKKHRGAAWIYVTAAAAVGTTAGIALAWNASNSGVGNGTPVSPVQ